MVNIKIYFILCEFSNKFVGHQIVNDTLTKFSWLHPIHLRTYIHITCLTIHLYQKHSHLLTAIGNQPFSWIQFFFLQRITLFRWILTTWSTPGTNETCSSLCIVIIAYHWNKGVWYCRDHFVASSREYKKYVKQFSSEWVSTKTVSTPKKCFAQEFTRLKKKRANYSNYTKTACLVAMLKNVPPNTVGRSKILHVQFVKAISRFAVIN